MQLSIAIDTETGLATATFPADQLQAVLAAIGAAPKPEVKPRVFPVRSDSRANLFYDVVYDPLTGMWTCTCPDFKHRSPRSAPEQYVCKHILRVQFYPAPQLCMS